MTMRSIGDIERTQLIAAEALKAGRRLAREE
jgi:hypothetical protein